MPLLTELAETVVGCGSYKHAAPTELGACPGGTVAINMPLLTELEVFRRHGCYKHAASTELGGCPGGTVAINMLLLTEMCRGRPVGFSSVGAACL